MKLYDCSPVITEDLPVWPGDVPFSRSWNMRTANGGTANLSSIQTTLHVGSHVDAPFHYDPAGLAMDECPLDVYWGRAVVLAVMREDLDSGLRIKPGVLDRCRSDLAPRVLFKTDTFRFGPPYAATFASLSPELIDALADRGVSLAGIDTPSVDPFDDDRLLSHHAAARRGVFILEGLVLKDVPPGEYELTALPLRIGGADGSPVRAVLRPV